jgi:hypothetical protein
VIEIQLPQLEEAAKKLKGLPDKGRKALSKAINDVLVSGTAIAIGDIYARYNLKESDIRTGFKAIKANEGHLVGIIQITGRRFPIEKFSPKQTPEGVEFEEVRGKTSLLKGVFEATMAFGINVFKRVGAERGPVQMQTGLSVAGMTKEEEKVLPDIKRRIHEQIQKRLNFWVSEALKGK